MYLLIEATWITGEIFSQAAHGSSSSDLLALVPPMAVRWWAGDWSPFNAWKAAAQDLLVVDAFLKQGEAASDTVVLTSAMPSVNRNYILSGSTPDTPLSDPELQVALPAPLAVVSLVLPCNITSGWPGLFDLP